MTLEDETGFINLVVWPWVVERQRTEVMNARLLMVQGVVEREGQVVHLIAGKLRDLSGWLGRLTLTRRLALVVAGSLLVGNEVMDMTDVAVANMRFFLPPN